MKKLILSAALLTFLMSAAQKKEVQAAYKAIESGDISTANSQIAAAESAMNGKTYLLEPEILEQYYYTKGLALLKSGDTAQGATFLAQINELGKSKIYVGKDSNKNKVYFVGKSSADASGISGLKEETFVPVLSTKLGAQIDPVLQSSNKAALDAYNGKNYQVAGQKFKEVYDLLKATGVTNERYLYNAALSYAYSKNYDNAGKLFMELINSGYTGVETTYSAKEIATGEVSTFEKGTWEALKKSSKEYTDFKTEMSESAEQGLYETAAAIFNDDKKYEQVILVTEKGLKKFPNNSRLSELQASAYYKTGKNDEFLAGLKKHLSNNPNDAVSWYNLGVMQSKDPASVNESLASFEKAVKLDPKMTNAYQNLTYVTMGDDDAFVKQFNELKAAKKTDQLNKLMEERRERFRNAIPYAEKWYQLDPTSLNVVSLLKGMYQTTNNQAKFEEFKAKEAALQK